MSTAVDDIRELTKRFWRAKSINELHGITSAETLWAFLRGRCPDLAKWNPPFDELYFRGQSDIEHGFTTSLFRAVDGAKNKGAKAYDRLTEKDLSEAEQRSIRVLRQEGIGRRLSDGEMLMLMQHHLGPTRLLDVSRTPLDALYFAVERNEDRDAALFIVQPHNIEGTAPLDLRHADDQDDLGTGHTPLPWSGFSRGTKNAKGDWTNQVRVVDHEGLDPRMRAQNGVFLVGGLIRHTSGIGYRVSDSEASSGIAKDQISRITNFAVNWTNRRASAPTTATWGATGWVLTIDKTWKRKLQKLLAREANISESTIYPPVVEVVKLMKHVIVEGAEGKTAARGKKK